MSKLFAEELHQATERECGARWYSGRPGELFRCGFCGHNFVEGDPFRALYTNDITGGHGNPLVCKECNTDTPTLRQRWIAKHREWQMHVQNSFWWFHSLTQR